MIDEECVGLDTGVFVRLLQGHPRATGLFRRLVEHEAPAVVSCISLYELVKLRHRGVIAPEPADALLAEIPVAYTVIWLDRMSLIRQAAGLSHGNNIPMADALVLASCRVAGCDTIYTTDHDLERYEGKDLEIVVFDKPPSSAG
jgi:predicted nucleic acid-binding protein